MTPITMGADPEFFIRDERGNPFPIIGLIGGTKDAPKKVAGAQDGFAMQEDNVMAEYNIPPTSDPYVFADYVTRGRAYTMNAIRKARKGIDLWVGCSAMFPEIHLQHPQALTFGCSPDFDAYQHGRPLPRINPDSLYTKGVGAWRFAGGHVHIGYSEDTFGWTPPPFVVAAFCDVMLAVPMIAYGYDPQGERRNHYGTPGRYRPTAHGIEYRTLGNHWTMSERYALTVGIAVGNLQDEFRKGEARIRQLYNDLPWVDIRKAIATENSDTCAELRQFFRQQQELEVI